jgi:glycogen(starch) synthase
VRILLLGPYPPPHGGVQTNLVAIREALLADGVPCSVINLHRFRTGKGEGVHHPVSAFDTLRLLFRLRYDVAHLHVGGGVTPRLLALSLVCCLMPRKKAVLTFHSGGYPSSEAGRRAAPRTWRGFVFRCFDRVIAVNKEIEALFRRYGVPPGRLRLIYPHALPSRAPEVELPEPLARFLCEHSPVLITVGLLEPEYDLELQIAALGEIRKVHPRAGLVLVGAGSLEGALRETISRQPWAKDVLLCGDVAHEATLGAIALADVFLRTTLYDGDSVAVREALHLGTPVVATDNGMRPEGARLFPARDMGALCRAVLRALAAPRPEAAAREDDSRNIRAVLDLYKELSR